MPFRISHHGSDPTESSRPLRVVAEILSGTAARPSLAVAGGSAVRLIGLADLIDGRVAEGSDGVTWVELPPPLLTRHALRLGDVLVAARGSLPKVAWVTHSVGPAVATSNLLVVRARLGIRPGVLLAYLRSEAGVAAIRGISRSTSDQLSITARDLGDIEVPVPPVAEQASIHALVEASEIAYAAALTAAAQRRVAIQAIALNMLRNTTIN